MSVENPPDSDEILLLHDVERRGAFSAIGRLIAMIRSVMLLSITLLVAPVAYAAPTSHGDVSTAFGNTLLTIDPDGRSRKIWLEADGTWTGLSRRGLDLAGKWTAKGDKVCLKQSKPRLPGSMCETFPTEIGRSVETKDPSGKKVQLKLVKGHVAE